MKRLMVVAVVMGAFAVQAAEISYDTTTTVSTPLVLTEDTTITVPAGKTVTCSGVISGTGKLIKAGTGRLILSAANTYTGGTQIDGGKLQADNVQAFGPVNAELPIQVNSDCNGVSAADANVVAVVFNVADTFAYPINCAAWTDHGAKPAGSTSGGGNTLYNIAASIANVTLNGKITGGDVSFHAGEVGGFGNVTGCSGFSVKGDVECPGGCVAINTRGGSMAISGKVTAALVSHPTGSNWPSGLSLGSSQNAIGSYDIGRYVSGGGLTCGAENALPGCVIFSSMSAIANASSFLLGGKNQTIDRVLATQPANASLNIPLIGTTSGDAGKHLVASGTSPGSTSPATLTMKATGNATNDWAFSQALSVVWDPQGDYTILNVSRQHIMNGTIAVKGGCFAMDENCTFSNVAAVTVADGAVFSNACAAAGSLKALTTLTLGAGAKAYLPADALKEDAVTLRIDPTAEVIFPDGTESVSFGDIYVGERCLAAGSYRSTPDGWSRVLAQVKGVAMIVNANKSGKADVESATWDAGGADTLLHTKENWLGDETPQFDSLPVEATFAAGTEATVDRKTLVGSLTFAAPGDFGLMATGEEGVLRLSGGLFAADDVTTAHRYDIAAPLMLDVSQSWNFGTNANVTLSGPLSTPEAVDVTTTVSSYQPLWFVGTGESSYAGVWSFPNARHPVGSAKEHYAPCVFATGVNPFGGAGAIVKMAGGLQGGTIRNKAALPVFNTELSNALILSNATVGATLEFSHSASEDRYGAEIVAPDQTTNVVNGVVSNVRVIKVGARSKLVFNGPVSIHANDIGTDQSLCFKFDWRGGNDAEGTKQSVVEFNGCVTFPTGSKAAANMNQMVYATYCFNAPSNVMDSVGSKDNRYFTVSAGAEYAFADGRTDVSFRTTGPSYFLLNGHSQHIGSINAGYSTTSIESTSEATLRINQTKDVTFKGAFQSTVNVVKEGAGTLGLSNAKALAGKLRLAEGAVAPAAGALSDTTEGTFAGGTLTLPEGETSVFKAYYVEDGEVKPLPKGIYRAGDDSPIGGFLSGTGALRVRKSDIKTGITFIIR